jgi:hypothetical protein
MNKGLIEHFEKLTDPRVERTKRYPLIEIILLIIAGTVSGCDGWKSLKDFGEAKLDWLRKFLPYKDGIPVDDTLARACSKRESRQPSCRSYGFFRNSIGCGLQTRTT